MVLIASDMSCSYFASVVDCIMRAFCSLFVLGKSRLNATDCPPARTIWQFTGYPLVWLLVITLGFVEMALLAKYLNVVNMLRYIISYSIGAIWIHEVSLRNCCLKPRNLAWKTDISLIKSSLFNITRFSRALLLFHEMPPSESSSAKMGRSPPPP